jgi:hypothetical protein
MRIKQIMVNLATLPLDIVSVIEEFLSIHDLVQFYTSRNLILAYSTIQPRILKKLSSWKTRKRKYCAQCKHDAITCIEWTNDVKRDWIPWCTVHVNPCILNGIEFYCIGSLDVQGRHIESF